jgi:hypothetical protein
MNLQKGIYDLLALIFIPGSAPTADLEPASVSMSIASPEYSS